MLFYLVRTMRWAFRVFTLWPILILLSCRSGYAQLEHGSLIIGMETGSRIVVGADSRTVNMFKPQHTMDERCKILVFGNRLVFASAGYPVFRPPHLPGAPEGPYWDSYESARRSAGLLLSHNKVVTPRQLAQAWISEMERRILLVKPGSSSFGLTQLPIAAFFAGWGSTGEPSLLRATMIVHFGRNSFIVKDPLISVVKFSKDVGVAVDALGARDICTEVLFRTTERGRKWANQIDIEAAVMAPEDKLAFRLKRLGEFSVQYSEDKADIGLPFDVVELSKKGVRWVYGKKSCQKSY